MGSGFPYCGYFANNHNKKSQGCGRFGFFMGQGEKILEKTFA